MHISPVYFKCRPVTIKLSRNGTILSPVEIQFLKSMLYILIKKFIQMYTLKNQRLKIIQLEKARFIKVNELKLTEVELL